MLGNTAAFDTGGNFRGSGNFGLTQIGPFQNFDDGMYWSGMEVAPNSSDAWYFNAYGGYQGDVFKNRQFQAWALRRFA